MENTRPRPHFSDGCWIEQDDPLDAACDQTEGRIDAALEDLGYDLWCRIGDDAGSGSVPLTLTVYVRKDAPRFIVQVEGSEDGLIEHV